MKCVSLKQPCSRLYFQNLLCSGFLGHQQALKNVVVEIRGCWVLLNIGSTACPGGSSKGGWRKGFQLIQLSLSGVPAPPTVKGRAVPLELNIWNRSYNHTFCSPVAGGEYIPSHALSTLVISLLVPGTQHSKLSPITTEDPSTFKHPGWDTWC